jgi:ComF family protein
MIKYKSLITASLLREMFFPAHCALCSSTLLSSAEAYNGLCSDCARQFSVEDVPRCSRCGKPIVSEKRLCMSCRKKTDGKDTPEDDYRFAFDAAFVIFPYIGKYRQLLKAYKFGRRKTLARFFAKKLLEARHIMAINDDNNDDDDSAVWVPVPARPGKIKESGWEQIEELAKVLECQDAAEGGAGKKITVERTLRRLPSRSQKELNREERQLNLKDKIKCARPPAKNIILFDDVFTTGATLSVCAEELKAAGAQRVRGLCLFYD